MKWGKRYVGGRPSYYVLHYEFVEGIKEKRTPFRKEHLDQADKEVRKGKLLLGGASGDPPDSGLVVFKNVSEEEVEAFAASDPYVRNGLVTKW
ncbi:unnamed protein product [Ostreobium quekettii]|uniref:YCII-related domain-containing protein n=1 Tax=Ostreobium quekettii TaxID=121088 RepID=A0A8S1IP41_9CHLO|nr:unnamed protein product [Ostreobium quekettii]